MTTYKVLLVDDEEEVRNAIEQRINWEELGFEVIGKAQNGVKAMEIAEDVKKDNIESEVINARFLKPLDKKTIKKSILKNKNVITIEDGTSINGLGTAIKELIVEEKIKDVEIKTYSYPDEYIKHGTVDQLEKIYHIDKESIEKEVRGHKYE